MYPKILPAGLLGGSHDSSISVSDNVRALIFSGAPGIVTCRCAVVTLCVVTMVVGSRVVVAAVVGTLVVVNGSSVGSRMPNKQTSNQS